ncbi:hypothetical protein HK104_005685, partial [Borealophlyctis nickersoniae]
MAKPTPPLLEDALTVLRTSTHGSNYHTFRSTAEKDRLRTLLLVWYDKNQRTMPWRVPCREGGVQMDASPKSEEEQAQRAYEVWVSEVMLQQTQVATVIAYYTRWLKKWPTIFDLAKATPEEVNEVWAGLGYYSRAKRLHEGAQLVVKRFAGRLPRDAAKLEKEVPGIGPYTAGAIASIAYNLPAPLVDGNVVRVLSRLRSIGGDPKRKEVVALHWSLASEALDRTRPGHFNQALMDLGATICTPQNPACGKCPVNEVCLAFAEQKAHKIIAGEKFAGGQATIAHDSAKIEDPCTLCLSVPDIEDYSVTRYPLKVAKKAPRAESLLANLWDFPTIPIPITDPASESYTTRKELANAYLQSLGLDLTGGDGGIKVLERDSVGEAVHLFSHIRRRMIVEQVVVCGDVADGVASVVEGAPGGGGMKRKRGAGGKGGVRKKGKRSGVAEDEDEYAGEGNVEIPTAAVPRAWKWVTEEEMMEGGVAVPATLKKAWGVVCKCGGGGTAKSSAHVKGKGRDQPGKKRSTARRGKKTRDSDEDDESEDD